jgi:hypothetical protein
MSRPADTDTTFNIIKGGKEIKTTFFLLMVYMPLPVLDRTPSLTSLSMISEIVIIRKYEFFY